MAELEQAFLIGEQEGEPESVETRIVVGDIGRGAAVNIDVTRLGKLDGLGQIAAREAAVGEDVHAHLATGGFLDVLLEFLRG